ncbi:helix-turn-helix domain-containing protein [Chitinophaga oryziterrae]|uniref:Helix-turn-helix domain-containing protein n=1 Tax=Chitinophaga oryziterrae TaxID=1031224 RepID=A0A6N8JK07_9BACT|nr:AraC family transcriptional regulator [Chitinophaga oryziterrae]MVT44719.1 helix-turn-helix domain-containing protein [Chitinophaga oryziterrae]
MNIAENPAIIRFDVASKDKLNSSISQQLPQKYQAHSLKEATVQYMEALSGAYFTQEIKDKLWVINWLNFFIKTPITLQAVADRPMVALLFVLKGNITINLQGFGKLSLQKNKFGFYYIPANAKNAVDLISDEYDAIFISISICLLEEFAAQHPHFQELYNLQYNQNENARVLPTFDVGSDERKIIDAIRYSDLKGPAHKIFLQARIYDLLVRYFTAQNETDKNNLVNTEQEARLLEIQKFIQQNINLPLSIRALSRQAGMNLRSFERNFKRLFSLAPREYIEYQRIKEAAELLKNTNMSVNTISMHVGFAGSNYFSFVFRKHYYCSPRQYRQQWLESSQID